MPPLLERVYLGRGIQDPAQLDVTLNALLPADRLTGMDAAVRLLIQALERDHRTLVVGDFDADGATSTALGLRVLGGFGLEQTGYLVPNRFEYGYGLTPELVEVAGSYGPDLIITVDNGISSIEGVAVARARGIEVLVTDHHLPGAQLPAASAIVNPNLPDDGFPSKHLAGVGVIFYLLMSLRSRLRAQGWFEERRITEPNLAQYLDLVALGTVADVVPLDQNNRILVEQGLRRIRAGQGIPGIRSLLRCGGRAIERAVASDLGFAAGPRLNAAGRLQDMALGIECLLTDDETQAEAYAGQLDALNRERREIEGRMHSEALDKLHKLTARISQQRLPYGLCLYDAGWHEGVIGILAARIRERLQRPVAAFAKAGDGCLKGSCRSIPGVHVRDVLANVAARHPGLIVKFGGHAMAAGLTLAFQQLEAFRAAFDAAVKETVSPAQLEATLHSDGELSIQDLCLDSARMLRDAGPWGQGFPEPVFDGVFDIVHHRVVGGRHLKLLLNPAGAERSIDAIAFNYESFGWHERLQRIHIAYRLDVNEYQGLQSPQLIIQYLRPV